MNLEEKYKLNKQFPIRISMLKHSIKLNLDYAKNQLQTDARKTRSIGLSLKLANEDLEDIQYYVKMETIA